MFLRSNVYVLVCVFAALVFCQHTQAQIMGGTAPGQQLPHTVEPADLAGSSFGGDVNLFTGTYAANYSLGSVSTPGGLSLSLNLSSTSRTTAGNNAPLTQGIPYGEGWNLNLPTISVSSEAYQTFRAGEFETCQLEAAVNTGTNDTANYNAHEGQLYWYNPIVSIPGVQGGRAVFKELDGNVAVFVCNDFESYTELRLNGSTWDVHLEDGTVYSFTLAQKSYRAGANKRVLDYTNGILNDGSDNTLMQSGQALRVADRCCPRENT